MACLTALQINPEYLSAILLCARIHSALGDKKEHQALLDKALQLDPESVETPVAYAEYYLAVNNLPAVHDYVQQALAISPEDESMHLLAGELALKVKDTREAHYLQCPPIEHLNQTRTVTPCDVVTKRSCTSLYTAFVDKPD